MTAVGAGRDAIAVLAHLQGHDHLLDRGVAGPFADAVDRALDLARTTFYGGQGVGDRHAQVVMAMSREDHLRMPRLDAGGQIGEPLAHLLRRRIADGVGYVQGPRPGVGGGLQHIGQELGLGAEGVLGREFDVVEQGARIFD